MQQPEHKSHRPTAVCQNAVLLCVCLVVCGCGSEFSQVEGTVTLDDQPLAQAMVVFRAPGKPMASCRTDAEGHYEIRTGSRTGMLPGKYQVTVGGITRSSASDGSDGSQSQLITPQHYLDPKTSGLSAEVVDGGANVFDFQLTSQPQ